MHLAMKLNSPVAQRWLSAMPLSPPRKAIRLRQPIAQKRLAAQEGPLRNATNMGMFFLHKPDMKAVEIFPKDMPKKVCADCTCKGRKCTRENCAFKHPKKVGKLKKETINAIGNPPLQKEIGWLNKWHFLKVRSKLPKELSLSWEERMPPP